MRCTGSREPLKARCSGGVGKRTGNREAERQNYEFLLEIDKNTLERLFSKRNVSQRGQNS